MSHIIVTGAAGFIGSHLVDRSLAQGCRVTGVDNFTRGTCRNLASAFQNPDFAFIEANMAEATEARKAFRAANDFEPVSTVWHMAANSDIGAGITDPGIDLRDTFLTTFQTLAMMREFSISQLAFASSSAVYGDHKVPIHENLGPLVPISNYGAMKLASEGMISAAVESFLTRAWIFRFPNVIGDRATHGVIYDLMHKLRRSRTELEVLGDGSQEKPYLHVTELIDAMFTITGQSRERLNCFNIAGEGAGATVGFVAETVVAVAAPGAPIRYTGGKKGWTGDVPRYSYSTEKLTALGWRPSMTSEQAVKRAVAEIYLEICRP
jgi:UDP-glucose 4-epimerase